MRGHTIASGAVLQDSDWYPNSSTFKSVWWVEGEVAGTTDVAIFAVDSLVPHNGAQISDVNDVSKKYAVWNIDDQNRDDPLFAEATASAVLKCPLQPVAAPPVAKQPPPPPASTLPWREGLKKWSGTVKAADNHVRKLFASPAAKYALRHHRALPSTLNQPIFSNDLVLIGCSKLLRTDVPIFPSSARRVHHRAAVACRSYFSASDAVAAAENHFTRARVSHAIGLLRRARRQLLKATPR